MSSSPTEQTVEVTLPELAGDVLEAIVVGWEKHPGDWVDADEPICIVSANGLRAAVASSASGYMVRLLAGVGARVGPGTSLAEIAAGDPSVPAKPAQDARAPHAAEPAPEPAIEPKPGAETAPEPEAEAESEPEPEPEPEPEAQSEPAPEPE